MAQETLLPGNQAILRHTLQVVTAVVFLCCLVFMLLLFIGGYQQAPWVMAVGVGLSALLYPVTWYAPLHVGLRLTTLLTFGLVTGLLLVGEGIRDEALLGYAITLATAGLLQGRRGVITYTVLCIAAVTAISYAQLTGRLALPDPTVLSSGRIGLTLVLLAFIGAIQYVGVNYLLRLLAQVQHSQTLLKRRNQQLESMHASLESQVIERTQHIEAARRQAEAVQQQTAIQAWLNSGRVQLSEALSGEQELTELCTAAVTQICTYMRADIGALFVLRGTRLRFAGGFAYAGDRDASFENGEGLIGQVALQKQPMLLHDISPDLIYVPSALGRLALRHLALTPLITNGQIVGVLEIGSTNRLGDNEIEFMNGAAESLGAAILSCLTRTQVQRLLEQTRQQAQDLQAREEELRAMNEELEAQTEELRTMNEALHLQAKNDPPAARTKAEARR